MTWELWGVLAPLLAGALGYLGKKYIDLRVSRAVSGTLEVLRKAQLEKFELTVTLGGLLAEIAHCINHIRDGDAEYGERCREMSLELRRRARSGILLIGNDRVAEIMQASDVALRYADKPSDQLYRDWEELLPDAMHELNASLKHVGYKGTDGAGPRETHVRPTKSLKRTPGGAA